MLDVACVATTDQFLSASVSRVGDVLAKVLDSQGDAAGEAMVILLGYDIGNSYQYDLLHEVTARGTRMLPYLAKAKAVRDVTDSRACIRQLLVFEDTRESDVDLAIDMIKLGKVWGVDGRGLRLGTTTSAQLADRILRLACEMELGQSSWRVAQRLDWLVTALVAREGRDANEALARVSFAYLGEAAAEEAHKAIIARGARMQPLLKKYKNLGSPFSPPECRE